MCVLFYDCAAQTVVLDSSVGMRQECPGEMVTYTCTVNQGVVLDWIVEPFLPTSARIRFINTDTIGRNFDCNDIATLQCEDLNFVATLTNIANRMAIVPDITSTLTFTATSRLNGTLVQCRGVTADATPMNSSTLKVAGVPMLLFVSLQLKLAEFCYRV